MNRVQVGQDGEKRASNVSKGNDSMETLRFANLVVMRVAGKVHGGVISERWFEGLYVGMRFRTNEAVVMQFSIVWLERV